MRTGRVQGPLTQAGTVLACEQMGCPCPTFKNGVPNKSSVFLPLV